MVFLTLQIFERGWWCRKRRYSPSQRFRGSFGHLCLLATCVWEQGHCWVLQLLPQNSWVYHIILDNYSIYPAFVLFELQGQDKQQSHPLWLQVSLLPKAWWCAGAVALSRWAEPQTVQLQRDKRNSLGLGERWQKETQCVCGLCVWLGLLQPRHSGCL